VAFIDDRPLAEIAYLTANTRGLPLSAADILEGHLVRLVNEYLSRTDGRRMALESDRMRGEDETHFENLLRAVDFLTFGKARRGEFGSALMDSFSSDDPAKAEEARAERETCKSMLGNLCLLPGSVEKKLLSQGFDDKRPVLLGLRGTWRSARQVAGFVMPDASDSLQRRCPIRAPGTSSVWNPPRLELRMKADIDKALAEFLGCTDQGLGGLRKLELSDGFERFVLYSVLRRWHLPDIVMDDVHFAHTGAGDDNQLDGLAVLIDGELARDAQHARQRLEDVDEPTVEYVFLQATLANRFQRAKMNEMVTGIENFFSDQTYFPENAALVARRQIKDAIREVLGEDAPARELISVYFVSTGTWPRESSASDGDGPLGWRAFAEQRLVRSIGLVAAPNLEVLDQDRLSEVLDELRTRELAGDQPLPSKAPSSDYSRTIAARELLPMPELTSIAKGYLGFLHARELLKLLERDDGQGLRHDVAFHNVRAFQGMENLVNTEIARTLAGPEQAHFLLRNNGVTIVARAASWVEGELRLDNYQIVNGWQTSSVLYRQRNHLTERSQVYLPVKIVVTDDADLREGIVRATNRQTAVTDLQQIAQARVVRLVETELTRRREQGEGEPIWFERRSGQYRDAIEVPEERVVSVKDLVAVMASTFRRQPHAAGQNAVLAPSFGKQLFARDHDPVPYLVGVRILTAVRGFLAGRADRTLDRFENHLCYALALLADPSSGKNPRDLSNPHIVAQAQVMAQRLEDGESVAAALEVAGKAVMSLVGSIGRRTRKWRDLVRVKKLLTVPLQVKLQEWKAKSPWSGRSSVPLVADPPSSADLEEAETVPFRAVRPEASPASDDGGAADPVPSESS